MTNWIHQRVTARRPCDLCGRTSYCSYDPLHGAIFCTRQESKVKMGEWGWRHETAPTPAEYDAAFAIDGEQEPLPELGEGERAARTAVYQAMIDLCGLHDDDHLALVARGFSEADIARDGYFTLPGKAHVPGMLFALRQVAADMEPVQGILPANALTRLPGMYLRGRDELCMAALPRGGICIPVRDAAGYIVGLRVRARDEDVETEDIARYSWISSSLNRSGAPCHIAHPVQPSCTLRHAILITEGEFKANTVARQMGVIAISVPGVDAQRALSSALLALRAHGDLSDATSIIIAFDQDEKLVARSQVQRALDRLIRAARAQTKTLLVAWWRPAFKGIDDALLGGERVRLTIHSTAEERANRQGAYTSGTGSNGSNAWMAKASSFTGRTRGNMTTGRTRSIASTSRAGSISTPWRPS